MHYVRIFDVSEKGVNGVALIVCAGIALIGLAGLVNKTAARASRLHPLFSLIIGLLTGVGAWWWHHDAQQYYVHVLTRNQAQIVEGRITQFQTWPRYDHRPETFTVNAVSFSYAPLSFTPAYTWTQAQGGPMRNDLWVRIHYTPSREQPGTLAILRLEILQE